MVDGQPVNVEGMAVSANAIPGQPGQPMPGQPGGQPGASPMPGVAPTVGPLAPVSRSTKPEFVADPNELKIKPNPDGKIRVNFHGQPWPGVLDWYSRTAGVSLDWQELPGDYLNLTTQREYSMPEVQDLVNRHLMARGFTLLKRGELLTVENLKKLDPSSVPRVRPNELKTLPDYSFVKVSFPLKWMLADDAVEELKPMLSPNGKLNPLKHTNRIEAMDAAVNLRDIWEMLEEEQAPEGGENLVKPFKLVYVRVEDVIDQVRELMGQRRPPSSSGGGGSGGGFDGGYQMQQMMQQQMQQMQQMQQQMGQQPGGKGPKKEAEVRIVAVARENTLLVDAPPDKMAKIAEAIQILDQPSDRETSVIEAIDQTRIFRLHNLSPKSFAETINKVAGLSPRTTVQIDEANRALVVSGNRADLAIVDMLVKKLDGNARTFQVIGLRKLPADYVAGSIRFMMGKEVEQQSSSQSRRSYFYDPFGGFGGRQQEEKKSDDFRVDADVEHNRLLLWCNDNEFKDIEALLIKLGELPAPGGNPNNRRVYEAGSVEDALELLKRVQKAWPNHSKHPLRIQSPDVPEKSPLERPQPKPLTPDQIERNDKPGQRTPNREARLLQSPQESLKPALANRLDDETAIANEMRTGWKPMLRPTVILASDQPRGRIVLTSDDQPPAVKPLKPMGLQDGVATSDDEPKSSADPEDALRKLVDQIRKQRATEGRGPAPTGEAPPITIRISENGQLHLECDDPAVLDLLEDVLNEQAPPRSDWKVFQLKHATTWAYGIELTLKDLFKEEMEVEKKGGGIEYDPFWGFVPGSNKSTGARRLSKRKPMKIISDRDTQTILVQSANADQLRMIQDVINIYDRAQSTEGHARRVTKIFQLKFGKARQIAEAVKDVYRDLLSENDKSMQEKAGGNGKKDDRPSAPSYTYIYGGGKNSTGGGEDDKKEQPIKFKGLLSVGIDESSNILIVSATEGLLMNVGQIIDALDEAAKPNASMRVVQLDSRVNPKLLQQKLHSILGPKPAAQGKQPNQPNQQNGQPNANQGQAVQVGE